MAQRFTTLEELKGQSLEGVLNEVAQSEDSLTVVLEEGTAMVISSEVNLKPLPELEGEDSRSVEGRHLRRGERADLET